MPESVYKLIEVVGSSTESWEKAAAAAIATAKHSLRDMRVAEVMDMDVHIEDGKPLIYRTKLKISFRFHEEDRH